MRTRISAMFAVLALVIGGLFATAEFRFNAQHLFPDGNPYGYSIGAASVRNATDVPTVPPPQHASLKYRLLYDVAQVTMHEPVGNRYRQWKADELRIRDLVSKTVVESVQISRQRSAAEAMNTAWFYDNLVVSPDGDSLFVRWYNWEESAMDVYTLGDGGVSVTLQRTFLLPDTCPHGYSYLFMDPGATTLTIINRFGSAYDLIDTRNAGCQVTAITGGTQIRSISGVYSPDTPPTYSPDIPAPVVAPPWVVAAQDPDSGDIAVLTSQGHYTEQGGYAYEQVLWVLRPGETQIRILDVAGSDSRPPGDDQGLLLFGGKIYAVFGSSLRQYTRADAYATGSLVRAIPDFRSMVATADERYVWVANSSRAGHGVAFTLYPSDFSTSLTTISMGLQGTPFLESCAQGYSLAVTVAAGDGPMIVINPSVPGDNQLPLWGRVMGYVAIGGATLSAVFMLAWLAGRRRHPAITPKPAAHAWSWWASRAWVGVCAVVCMISLVMLTIPLISSPRGGLSDAHQVDTGPQLDPRVVSEKYGVYYSLGGPYHSSVIIHGSDGQRLSEIASLVQDFGDEHALLTSVVVSPDGTLVYVYSQELLRVGVYVITDNGKSLSLDRTYLLPDECWLTNDMYIDRDGLRLTLIPVPETRGSYAKITLPVPHAGNDILGCRVSAADGSLLNPIRWGPDTPAATLDTTLYDPATDDIYFLSGSQAVHSTVSVLRFDGTVTKTLPPPTDTNGLCPCSSYAPGMVLDPGFLYALFGASVYRYSLSDLDAAPALVWREPDSAAWHPIALVRTADQQHWWVIADRTTSSWEFLWLTKYYSDPRRYSLYSDSFAQELTSTPGERDSDVSVFMPSATGDSLRVGTSGRSSCVGCAPSSLDGYYSCSLVVDPSVPRPIGERWNWWYATSFGGFLAVGLVSWLIVRRASRAQDAPHTSTGAS